MTSDRPQHVVLERLAYDADAWEAMIADHPDLEVFHGSAWLDYLAASQQAEPVIAAVRADGQCVGYFVGAMVRRYGVRILGSPLRGWGTQCMGFLLDEGFDRRAAATALPEFAFGKLGCLHVELADRHLTAELMAGSGYEVEIGKTFVVDLVRSEEEIFAGMRRKTRQYLRGAARDGVRAEIATELDFADDFHEQLVEVFAHQGLAPTYGVERVRQLITSLQPAGQLLLVRVRAPDGRCVSSGLSIGRGRTAVLWGGAFRRAHSELRPNEVMWWEAIRRWRSRGALRVDMGGAGDYKAKYGGVESPTFHFHRSRYGIMRHGRSAVRKLFRARQVLAGRRAHGVPKPGAE
jgi:CelD/BcsL family acetyltransferase involved in cellulose biosynthesis